MNPFGEICGVGNQPTAIRSKIDNKKSTMLYVGRVPKNLDDVFKILNLSTIKFVKSRNVKWLAKLYGFF